MNSKDSHKYLSNKFLENLPPDELISIIREQKGKLDQQDVLLGEKRVKYIKKQIEQIQGTRTKIQYIFGDDTKKYKVKTQWKKKNPASYILYQYDNIRLVAYPFDQQERLFLSVRGGLTSLDHYNVHRMLAIMNKAKYYQSGSWKEEKQNESPDAIGLRKAYTYSFNLMRERNLDIKIEENNKFAPPDKKITKTRNLDGSFRKKRSDAGKPRKKKE